MIGDKVLMCSDVLCFLHFFLSSSPISVPGPGVLLPAKLVAVRIHVEAGSLSGAHSVHGQPHSRHDPGIYKKTH